MTKEQFKILVKAMKAVYTQPTFIPDQDAFDVWYSMLKDLDYAVASRAVQMHMQTEESSPTVAGIRKQSVKITGNTGNDLNENEAWSLVLKAVQRSGYYSEEEFAKLPKIIQRTIGSPSRLREMALDEKFNHGVESSNFQNKFRIEQQREREKQKLSPDVARIIHEKEIPQIRREKIPSVEEQRMISEVHSSPAPEGFSEIVRRRIYEQQTKEKSKTV